MGAPALRPAGPRHPRVSESHGHTTAYSAHGRAATHAPRARTIPTTRRDYGSSPTGSVERTTPSSSRSPDASEQAWRNSVSAHDSVCTRRSRLQSSRRLVEHDDRCFLRERTSHEDALVLSAREGGERSVRQVAHPGSLHGEIHRARTVSGERTQRTGAANGPCRPPHER